MRRPRRIVWSRRRGWKPPRWHYYSTFVGVGSHWANPHRTDNPKDDVDRYRDDLEHGRLPYTVDDVRRHLRSLNLGCYCRNEPCHSDVLLDVANRRQ
jgi:hypothetical protein